MQKYKKFSSHNKILCDKCIIYRGARFNNKKYNKLFKTFKRSIYYFKRIYLAIAYQSMGGTTSKS